MHGRNRRGGDGFLACSCGKRHWGHFGAAGLLLHREGQVLLQHRAAWSHEGGTWAVPGGALDVDETPLQAALREAAEEAAVPAASVRPRHAWTVDHGTWAYTTVVAEVIGPVTPRRLDGESAELRWVAVRDVGAMRLHSGFAAAWPQVAPLLDQYETVVVDAANVVGARPDGWWHDRAGAAGRLLDQLATVAAAGLPRSTSVVSDVPGRTVAWPDWVVVLEGAARPAQAQDRAGIEVVTAGGHGDDAIVAQAESLRGRGRTVTVVTSDRDLQSRVAPLPARTVGARSLLAALG